MNVVKAGPANPRTHAVRRQYQKHHNWTPLLTALKQATPGTWLSIPLDEIPGYSTAHKQTKVIQMVRRHLGLAQTQTEDGKLFVRLTDPKSNQS